MSLLSIGKTRKECFVLVKKMQGNLAEKYFSGPIILQTGVFIIYHQIHPFSSTSPRKSISFLPISAHDGRLAGMKIIRSARGVVILSTNGGKNACLVVGELNRCSNRRFSLIFGVCSLGKKQCW